MFGRRAVTATIAIVVIAWALVPLARGVLLVQRGSPAVAFAAPPGIASRDVSFAASDGVRLAGTLLPVTGARAAVVLVHGFKNTRADMLEHASFLHAAGYSVLLYDSRGCGQSEGTFGVGATEDRDVRGAISYLKTAPETAASPIAVLGVSLGAGDALLAAARDDRIDAVIADSSWADERAQLDRMSSVSLGPLRVPLLPYEASLVDALVGGRLEDARPRDEIAAISPRSLLLIHSADDTNATTPLSDARELFAAAGEPRDLWVVPSGGHAGALGAHRDEYTRRVLAFLGHVFR